MGLHPALYALLEKRPALERLPVLPAQLDTSVKKAALKFLASPGAIVTTIVIARIARRATNALAQWTAFHARLGALVMKKAKQLQNLGQSVKLAQPENINQTRGRPRALTVPRDSSAQSRLQHQLNVAILLYTVLQVHLSLKQLHQDIIQYQKSTQTREN